MHSQQLFRHYQGDRNALIAQTISMNLNSLCQWCNNQEPLTVIRQPLSIPIVRENKEQKKNTVELDFQIELDNESSLPPNQMQ